jgi:hypothetical protein
MSIHNEILASVPIKPVALLEKLSGQGIADGDVKTELLKMLADGVIRLTSDRTLVIQQRTRKTLAKSVALSGQTETITAMDFRRTPGDILLQAQMGKVFSITKNGVVIAVLSPPEFNALELGSEIRRLKLAK